MIDLDSKLKISSVIARRGDTTPEDSVHDLVSEFIVPVSETNSMKEENLDEYNVLVAKGWDENANSLELQSICHFVENHSLLANRDGYSKSWDLDNAFIKLEEMSEPQFIIFNGDLTFQIGDELNRR